MEREAYINSLRKAKFKITPQRLRVIDFVMWHTPGHFTAEHIYREIHQKEPSMTLATIYNIMKALRASDTIESFEFNGQTWFESNKEFHGNLACVKCGNIYDVDLERESILGSVDRSEYQVDEVNILMKGVCKSCLAKKTA